MSSVIETAKAATMAYNEKNWDRVKAMLAPDSVHDEKPTHSRIRGIGQILEAWKGWATAITDSKATFLDAHASGNTAVLEVAWRGVHSDSLHAPSGTIPASHEPIEIPACQVVTVEGGRVKHYTYYFEMRMRLTQIGATAR